MCGCCWSLSWIRPDAPRGALGAVPFGAVTRADLDAVFRARLDAVQAALAATRQVAALRTEGRDVPGDLLTSATLAGRSTKGGHVGLNRFKARVRHLFNWAIAQGYRDDTPFKRHGVNVVRLDGAAETVRTRRLLPGEEDALMAVATPHLRGLLIAALSTGCRLGELLVVAVGRRAVRRGGPGAGACAARGQDQDGHPARRPGGAASGRRARDVAD